MPSVSAGCPYLQGQPQNVCAAAVCGYGSQNRFDWAPSRLTDGPQRRMDLQALGWSWQGKLSLVLINSTTKLMGCWNFFYDYGRWLLRFFTGAAIGLLRRCTIGLCWLRIAWVSVLIQLATWVVLGAGLFARLYIRMFLLNGRCLVRCSGIFGRTAYWLGYVVCKCWNCRSRSLTAAVNKATVDYRSKPFPSVASARSKRVLELIHSDVCGPITPSLWDGKRYILTFIDDY